ncbi:MAG: hypothetical protein A2W09_02930 [Deltaproteobacteria bacterium RBG_16_50_11]|nr:MAG: hypothetical protein A2W09_02930 [Deltaproteobacteria bacterium RBG_16_50_11]
MGFLGFAKWQTKPEAIIEGLGEEWRLTRQIMKLYTCCNISHSSVYGLLDQMGRYHFKAEDISEINIEGQLSHVSEPKHEKWNPETVKQCQFSLPYTVAVAAYQGDVFMHSFTPEVRADPKIRELMTRIFVKSDPNVPFWGARITTTLINGKQYSKEYLEIKGHPQNPLGEKDIIAKFKKCVPYCACELKDDVVNFIIEAVLSLDTVDDVVDVILRPITPGRTDRSKEKIYVLPSY